LERNGLSFRAGQCFNLGLKGSGVNREYSIYSGENDPYLEFLIKEVKGGIVSPALRKVEQGTAFDLHGPYGSFTIDPSQIGQRKFLFIGTGTGIAPFHSFVNSYPNINYQIIFGIKTLSEQYDRSDYDISKIIYCVSRECWEGFNGRVTLYLKNITFDRSNICYLCGNQRMIHAVYDLLRENGFSGNQIFTEAFF
jgi:ferredoxin/flavodoxin---NADP+ reductase